MTTRAASADPQRRPTEVWAFLLAFLLVASIPPENGVTVPGVGSVSRVLGVLALAVTALSTIDRGWLRVRPPPVWLILAAAYVAWNAASFLWSQELGATMGEIVTVVQLLGMAWLLWQVTDTRGRLDALFGAFVLGNCLTIGVVLGRYVAAGGEVDFRDLGAFNANEFAIIASLAVPMAWRLATSAPHGLVRVAAGAYPALAFVAVLISASRGGLLVFLTALAVLVTGSMRMSLVRRSILFVTVALVGWGGFQVVTQVVPYWDDSVTRLLEVDEELMGGSLTGRRDIWAEGLDTFQEAPLLGIGAGAFRHVVGARLGDETPAHNALISILTTTGVIGLSLFLLTMGFALAPVLVEREGRGHLVVLAVTLGVAIMPTNSEADKFLWFLLAALGTVRPIVWTPGVRSRRPGMSVRQVSHRA